MSLLAKRIKEKRKEFGLTQAELANKVGLSVETIKKLESGQREPSIDTLAKLSDIFGCSTDYLLGRDEKEQIMKDVIDSFNALPPEKKRYVIDLIRMFKGSK